jgi:hypothetical protein
MRKRMVNKISAPGTTSNKAPMMIPLGEPPENEAVFISRKSLTGLKLNQKEYR